MYIDNENFDKWMEKLSKKLNEIGQDMLGFDMLFSYNRQLSKSFE